MEAIKDTIINVIQDLSCKKEAGGAESGPEALLKKALAKKELGHIKFNYFRKGVLGVKVDSSSWLYSLNLKKEKLISKLNAGSKLGVKDIRFIIGEIR